MFLFISCTDVVFITTNRTFKNNTISHGLTSLHIASIFYHNYHLKCKNYCGYNSKYLSNTLFVTVSVQMFADTFCELTEEVGAAQAKATLGCS